MTTKRTNHRRPTIAEIGDDLAITKQTRRAAGAGTWMIGTVSGHRFDGLVFPEHAECPDYELGDSQISKLWLQRLADKKCVANFDRGWDIRPRTKTAQAIVDVLTAKLTERIYYNKPASRRTATQTKDIAIEATEHRSAREAIEHVGGSYHQHAIMLDGKYLTATQTEVDRLAAAGIEFAYLVDRDGTIMTIPVNDR